MQVFDGNAPNYNLAAVKARLAGNAISLFDRRVLFTKDDRAFRLAEHAEDRTAIVVLRHDAGTSEYTLFVDSPDRPQRSDLIVKLGRFDDVTDAAKAALEALVPHLEAQAIPA